jgi:hypothetical protein
VRYAMVITTNTKRSDRDSHWQRYNSITTLNS